MFETTVVEARRRQTPAHRLTIFALSILAHAAAVAGALLSGVWQVTLPAEAPAQSMRFVSLTPLPIPPSSPPRQHEPAAAVPASRPATATPSSTLQPSPVVPSSVPDVIPDLPLASGEGAIGPSSVGGTGSPADAVGSGSGTGSGSGFGDALGPLVPGGDVRPPVALRRIEPAYPQLLVHTRMKGVVVLECIVGRDGDIEQVSVVRATHRLFEEAAVDAVRQWKFRAGSLNGRPVATIFQLTVNFELRR